MEQWGHRVAFGTPLERDRTNSVAVDLSLYLDTLDTFRLGKVKYIIRYCPISETSLRHPEPYSVRETNCKRKPKLRSVQYPD